MFVLIRERSTWGCGWGCKSLIMLGVGCGWIATGGHLLRGNYYAAHFLIKRHPASGPPTQVEEFSGERSEGPLFLAHSFGRVGVLRFAQM